MLSVFVLCVPFAPVYTDAQVEVWYVWFRYGTMRCDYADYAYTILLSISFIPLVFEHVHEH